MQSNVISNDHPVIVSAAAVAYGTRVGLLDSQARALGRPQVLIVPATSGFVVEALLPEIFTFLNVVLPSVKTPPPAPRCDVSTEP